MSTTTWGYNTMSARCRMSKEAMKVFKSRRTQYKDKLTYGSDA